VGTYHVHAAWLQTAKSRKDLHGQTQGSWCFLFETQSRYVAQAAFYWRLFYLSLSSAGITGEYHQALLTTDYYSTLKKKHILTHGPWDLMLSERIRHERKNIELSMVVHDYNPSLWRLRQEDCEF
jgi:hypothetical protein